MPLAEVNIKNGHALVMTAADNDGGEMQVWRHNDFIAIEIHRFKDGRGEGASFCLNPDQAKRLKAAL